MNLIEANNRSELLIKQLLEVWEDSVKATHTFLSNKEIENIKKYVPHTLKNIPYLIIAKNKNDIPVAFMGIDGQKLEMLFIKNNERSKGLGKQLLNYGIEKFNIKELTVNEQNPAAKGVLRLCRLFRRFLKIPCMIHIPPADFPPSAPRLCLSPRYPDCDSICTS